MINNSITNQILKVAKNNRNRNPRVPSGAPSGGTAGLGNHRVNADLPGANFWNSIDESKGALLKNMGYDGLEQAELIGRKLGKVSPDELGNAFRNVDISDARRKELLALEAMTKDPEFAASMARIKHYSALPESSFARKVNRTIGGLNRAAKYVGYGVPAYLGLSMLGRGSDSSDE